MMYNYMIVNGNAHIPFKFWNIKFFTKDEIENLNNDEKKRVQIVFEKSVYSRITDELL